MNWLIVRNTIVFLKEVYLTVNMHHEMLIYMISPWEKT